MTNTSLKWDNYGVIWRPSGNGSWATQYATCPTPILLNDRIRIFLQMRDAANVGRVGYVDVSSRDPSRVLASSASPVLDVGEKGCFDDNGVFQTSAVRCLDGRLFLYYVGFELCHHVRYRLLTGLAISEDDGLTFTKHQSTPILERSAGERLFRCGSFVIQHPSGKFSMWYVAGSSWTVVDDKDVPLYDLRYMESSDGIDWPSEGKPVQCDQSANEYGYGRPWVIINGDELEIYFSKRLYKPDTTELAYAEASENCRWRRDDEALCWDFGPATFPALVQVNERRFCFYNDAAFGQNGLALAVSRS